MKRPSRLLLLALLLAAPVGAQEQGVAPDADGRQRLARVAKAYEAAAWPAAGPAVVGLELAGLAERLGPAWTLEAPPVVDPARGEARLRVGSTPATPAVVATARVFASAAAAREGLLALLGATQAHLPALAGVGDVAFAGRTPTGATALVYAARGNVLLTARALDPAAPPGRVDGAEADGVEAVARALDGLVVASPGLAPGKRPPAPRVLELRPVGGPARAGAATRLEVVFDPMAPAPAHLRLACDGDASVVEVPGGLELLAPTRGPVVVRVFAASAGLVAAPPVEVKLLVD